MPMDESDDARSVEAGPLMVSVDWFDMTGAGGQTSRQRDATYERSHSDRKLESVRALWNRARRENTPLGSSTRLVCRHVNA